MDTHAAQKPVKRARWRRHLRFTREGRVFVFVTFGLGFAAVNTGTNLMYLVFGFMLSLIILSGILSEHVLRKLKVQRRLPGRAFVGEPVLIEVAVRNGKEKLGSYSVEVEDHAEAEPNDRRCYFLKIGAREEQISTYRRIPKRRGRMLLTTFRISTRFPFSLFEKWREIDILDELVVLPALIPTVLSDALGQQEGGDRGTSKGRGTETRELREYRSGDEMRAIHWRRSAALGKVVVRELEREAAQLISIQLDNAGRAGDPSFEADFEERISRAASLVERAVARGYGVEICARGQRSPRLEGHSPPDPAWRFLALIAAVDERSAPAMAQPTRGARLVRLEQFSQAAPKDAA
jgi:uncharacterized protein (DUF58 family)